jgi:F-type H+-transporting ATPase subunit delta
MMNPRLATRYAKSILDLAVERNELETVFQDMLYLEQLTNQSKEFVSMLRSPVVPSDKKVSVIKAITDSSVSKMTSAFLVLLVKKGREGVLPEMIKAFIRQYKIKKNIHVVKLTTAAPISDEVRDRIVQQVKDTSNMQLIELETSVDPKLIGGFVLQAGDKLVDASIYYDLKEVSRQFENNDFIYKVR